MRVHYVGNVLNWVELVGPLRLTTYYLCPLAGRMIETTCNLSVGSAMNERPQRKTPTESQSMKTDSLRGKCESKSYSDKQSTRKPSSVGGKNGENLNENKTPRG